MSTPGFTPFPRRICLYLCGILLVGGGMDSLVYGQENSTTPPREVPLKETPFLQLSNHSIDRYGDIALAIESKKWKHAETENLIIHYRRATEARRAVREIEFTLWFVSKFLEAAKLSQPQKAHVFIFEDKKEWEDFLAKSKFAHTWADSFAYGGNLFLNIGGASEGFNSFLLAHETTHIAVSRIYQQTRWPLWLNEGFAEYMASAAIAARRGQTLKSLQRPLEYADIPRDTLLALSTYPSEEDAIWAFYQSSERLIRFLLTRLPKEQFTHFVDEIVRGSSFETALLAAYPKQIPNLAKFEKEYAKFKK